MIRRRALLKTAGGIKKGIYLEDSSHRLLEVTINGTALSVATPAGYSLNPGSLISIVAITDSQSVRIASLYQRGRVQYPFCSSTQFGRHPAYKSTVALAKADFNGIGNKSAYRPRSSDVSYAGMDYAQLYTFPDGASGYAPACGELFDVFANYGYHLNQMCPSVFDTDFNGYAYWSSTLEKNYQGYDRGWRVSWYNGTVDVYSTTVGTVGYTWVFGVFDPSIYTEIYNN